MHGNRRITQFLVEVGAPVHLQSGRQKGIEETWQHRVRHRPHVIEQRLADAAHGSGGLFSLFGSSSRAPDHRAHFLIVQMLRKQQDGRNDHECEEDAHVFRRLSDKLSISLDHLRRLV